jgi:hypothetical protein
MDKLVARTYENERSTFDGHYLTTATTRVGMVVGCASSASYQTTRETLDYSSTAKELEAGFDWSYHYRESELPSPERAIRGKMKR